ncbi:MAG TPA: LuxR C-terminal-related transcriptional regulator [Jatrophihabitans sp.]|nr:LuxR C-terminal-related transcriptional regulator [Jatrophihabitans sp.]
MTQPPLKATAVLEPPEEWFCGTPLAGSVLLERPRLLSRLAAGSAGPVTCVSGPAGSGKTGLAESWLAGPQRPPVAAAWLTVDPEAELAGRFWQQCLAALGEAGLPVDGLAGLPTARLPAALAGRLADRAEPTLLVLDDFHRLRGRALVDGLDLLVRRATPNLRLLLLTRAEPALPSARYRIAGGYTEIRGDELAFTAEEAGQVLADEAAPASPAALATLMARTEGWVTGVRLFLAGLPPAAGPADLDRQAELFGGEDRWVANYFEREVLDELPPGTRTFLERVSIVDRLPVGLAAELTGRADAEQLLAGLAARNAFVEQCGPDCYRCHPLLRDLLRLRLRRDRPDEVADLHRAAAGWRARAGAPREALAHAAESGDWRFLARLVVEEQLFAAVLAGGPISALVRAGRAVPEPEMWRNPDAAVVGALLALQGKDDLRVRALLERLRVMIRTWPRPNARFAASAIELRLAMRRPDAPVDAARLADEALAALAEATIGDPAVRAELRCLISAERALALVALDRLDEARAVLVEALEAAAGSGSEQSAGCQLLHAVEAFTLALQGDLGQAGAAAQAVLDQPGSRPGRAATYCQLALAWVHAERAEPAPARLALAAASDRALRQDVLARTVAALLASRVRGQSAGSPRPAGGTRAPAPLLVAMRAAALGEPAAAEHLLTETGGTSPVERAQLARTMLALDRPTDALQQLSELPEQAGLGSLCSLVDAHLTLARAADETGDAALAARSLGTALRLARRERIRRPFLDERRWLRRSLGYLVDNPDRYGWLGPAVLGPQAATPAGRPAPLTQPLSEREREVVRKLAEMLSTEEIAVDLFLSVNTVKTHLRSIYRKLAASRRGEAVRRARELGIL